jgi:hypothetical protein
MKTRIAVIGSLALAILAPAALAEEEQQGIVNNSQISSHSRSNRSRA